MAGTSNTNHRGWISLYHGRKKKIQKTLLQKLYMKEIRLGTRSIYATAVVVVFGTGYA
ncbi:MAG: hypothetical protein M3286_03450 [Thermoproteota archaeon]|nr:hypothetical protein [Thermoproteota archaeon]